MNANFPKSDIQIVSDYRGMYLYEKGSLKEFSPILSQDEFYGNPSSEYDYAFEKGREDGRYIINRSVERDGGDYNLYTVASYKSERDRDVLWKHLTTCTTNLYRGKVKLKEYDYLSIAYKAVEAIRKGMDIRVPFVHWQRNYIIIDTVIVPKGLGIDPTKVLPVEWTGNKDDYYKAVRLLAKK